MFLLNQGVSVWIATTDRTPTSHTYRFGNQLRQDVFLIVFRDSSDNRSKWRLAAEKMLLRDLAPQFVQVEIPLRLLAISLRLVVLYKRICYIGARSHISFILRWKFLALWQLVPLRVQHSHSLCRHDRASSTKADKNKAKKRNKNLQDTLSQITCSD